jgi:TolA-binding protein
LGEADLKLQAEVKQKTKIFVQQNVPRCGEQDVSGLNEADALIQLAKQRANTPEEDIILSRVAENLLGCASIEFRLAARIGSIKKKPTDFREFHNYLNQAVFYLTKIVKDNPSGDLLARAHYLRGKAYKELKKFKDASNDFKLVVDRFPNAPDANFACLALADILFDARDYKQNIHYLNKLVEYKGSTYGMALDRLALVHYVIDDIGSAIKYIKMEVAYIEKNPDAPGAENREKALNSAAQFYATAIQKHTPGYDVLGAIRLFKTLDKSADISKPLILFTNILRTKGFENELEEIKSYVVKGEVDPLVAANVVNSIFDFQLNRRQYGKVKQTITEIDGLITKLVDRGEKPENINKIRRDLANAITMVQKDFTENKDKSEGPTIGATLVILYNYSIKSSQDDPTFKIKAAYNLAETYYMMKKYKDAASYYQWIVQNASFATKEDKKLIEDAELKYLTARYEEVRVAQLFPKNLNAISLNKNDPKTIPDLAKDWIKALDMSHDKFNSFKGFDQMNFEANRLIYSYGHIEEAIDRFKTFITKYPESEFAMASASLVIDTYIATEDWKKTYDVAYFSIFSVS